jgi:serine/threonine-protein kinase
MSDLSGSTIGKFQIEEKLGGGGMADVYKAFQTSLNRHVAIKVIHRHLAQQEQFLSRFHREAQHVASLRHPNIVRMHDFDVFEDQPYMVMEYIEGPSLNQRMRTRQASKQPWSLEEVLAVIGDVGGALSYAHKKEMIHRDVKPANVMCDPSGRYILTDFGLAKILSGPSHTVTGTVMGTPAYMSPEQCQGQPGDDGADIYSLGIVLFELATGQLPFDSDSQLGFLLKHVNEPPPPPTSIKPDLPSWLSNAIMRALEKEVDDRYPTVDALLDDLLPNRNTITLPPSTAEPAAPAATAPVQPTEVLPPAFVPADKPVPKKPKRSRFGGLKRPKIKLPDVKVPGVSLDGLREKAEEAVAAIEEKQDQLSARRLETTERVRKGLQTRLEQAVDLAATAQKARYAILALGAEHPFEQEQVVTIVDTLRQHGGKIVVEAVSNVVALYELEGSSNEADKSAVDAAKNILATVDALRAGIHTGQLPTKEPVGEEMEVALAVEEAAPFGGLLLSHATYSRVRWDYEFEKQPSIRRPGSETPVQLYLAL